MSLICFPFKTENVATVLNNVRIAADAHRNVRLVLLIAACENACDREIEHALPKLQKQCKVPIRLIIQSRIGSKLRRGKGDGMNTALEYFLDAHNRDDLKELDRNPLQRIHFYDADIKSFTKEWIIRAEDAAELGYDVVRHYFARSCTDAMITWMITKVGFALCWPNSSLPWVKQPLGGELCFTRKVVGALINNPNVRKQSDWGIDTAYTFVCAQKEFSLIEIYAPEGKIHSLYGDLGDLKTMLCECFDAVRAFYIKGYTVSDKPVKHVTERAGLVPEAIKRKIGYDIENTFKLLKENWSEKQRQLLKWFDPDIADGIAEGEKWPVFNFMDENAWIRAYKVFLEHFDRESEDWRELLFKMWITRVLNYTQRHVIRGYDVAMDQNEKLVYDVYCQRVRELGAKKQNGFINGDINGDFTHANGNGDAAHANGHGAALHANGNGDAVQANGHGVALHANGNGNVIHLNGNHKA